MNGQVSQFAGERNAEKDVETCEDFTQTESTVPVHGGSRDSNQGRVEDEESEAMARTVSHSPQEWGVDDDDEKAEFVDETKQVTKSPECHEIAAMQEETMAMQRENKALADCVAELQQQLLHSQNQMSQIVHDIETLQDEKLAMQREKQALASVVTKLEGQLLHSQNEQQMAEESEEALKTENRRLIQQMSTKKVQSSEVAVVQRQEYEQEQTNPQGLQHVATDSGLPPTAFTRIEHRLQGDSPSKEQISEHRPGEF